MKIVSIEPTPSPNSMKINLDESLPNNISYNLKKEDKDRAPHYLQKLLAIDGVKGVYQVTNFIAVERNAKIDWKIILPKVREVFGEDATEMVQAEAQAGADSFGELKVFVHMFRDIPIQIKIEDGEGEQRYALPDRFKEAILKAQSAADNLVKERQWKDYGVRYGDANKVANEVIEELSAAYNQTRLDTLVAGAFKKVEDRPKRTKITTEQIAAAFKSEDWKTRYAALEKMDPKTEDLPLLAKALKDENTSIRRQAVVFLGMIESEEVLPFLYESLKDRSVTVRRTAGDCLSDIGHPKAIPAMIDALKDKNKLVRWRAAMFLYEVGDESALEALKQAEDDPEFEVSLQIKMAMRRIESGEEAAGSVWQQMTNARKVE